MEYPVAVAASVSAICHFSVGVNCHSSSADAPANGHKSGSTMN
jgi:hypothetical protein